MTPPEQARLAKLVTSEAVGSRMSFALAAAHLVFGVTNLIFAHYHVRNHDSSHFDFGVFSCAIALYWAYFGFRSIRPRGVPARATLEVTDAGFSGSVDRVPATINWRDISGVRDVADVYAVLLRKVGSRPIVIPKATLANPAAFWTVCEDHLIAKRGLIRPSRPRPLIVNTAC